MNVEEEIKSLKEKAINDRLTGYPECEKYHLQLASWLQELVMYRKQDLDLKKSIDRYNRATCRITPECGMCDAWNREGEYCELGLEEEKA